MKLLLLLAVSTALLSSCSLFRAEDKKALSYTLSKSLYSDASIEETTLKISLWDQRVYMLNAEQKVIFVSDVSTGIDGRETPAGTYKVLEMLEDKRSNRYGRYVNKETREVVVEKAWEHKGEIPEGCEYEGILMPYWMRLTWYGIGMHVGKFERRKRSSFGCIRVYEKAQPYIYRKVQLGTPIEIVEESLVSKLYGE